MKCPKCQFENREGARFCKECGNNLEPACSDCGTVYEMGSKFCDECGYKLEDEEKIDNAVPAAEGERKNVTVLFSDGILAQAYLDLGRLHKAKKRFDPARECISEAIKIFEEYEAEGYSNQAKAALASLKD